MRFGALILATFAVAQGAVVSHEWRGSTLTLRLDDGAAELEWISGVSFRFSRTWGEQADRLPAILHDATKVDIEVRPDSFFMKTRYMNVELNRADLALRLRSVDADVAALELKRVADGAELHITPLDKALGAAPFFMTRSGFGMYLRHPSRWSLDLPRSVAVAPRTDSVHYMFYYGPTLKEMLEQHLTVTGSSEMNVDALVPRPAEPVSSKATHVELPDVDSWDSLAALVRKLNRGSLSGILYPALDLSFADKAPADVRQRAQDLSTWVPVLFGSGAVDRATRERWKPYWITYLREAYDRGFPLIRPLEMQFSKDPNAGRQPDVFMFGDELLLAPVVTPGGKRRLDLPMGIWTDLRTNQEYKGRQTIEVDAPPGQVPMFTRNGALFPIAASGTMELHYFPSLGGEFFLWEPAVNENSQFHASPAADYLRLESESKIQRTYEWVVHHTGAPREVKEGATSYRKVAERSQLRPSTWWHDAERNDLHVMLWAEAGSDRIINIAFP